MGKGARADGVLPRRTCTVLKAMKTKKNPKERRRTEEVYSPILAGVSVEQKIVFYLS